MITNKTAKKFEVSIINQYGPSMHDRDWVTQFSLRANTRNDASKEVFEMLGIKGDINRTKNTYQADGNSHTYVQILEYRNQH